MWCLAEFKVGLLERSSTTHGRSLSEGFCWGSSTGFNGLWLGVLSDSLVKFVFVIVT